jgi:diguanylate cyclase (GGDEF)-like protein
VLGEEAFRHLLAREAGRATRYQDFFSVCLVRPDLPESDPALGERLHRAVSAKIAESLRATDLVGQFRDGVAVLLLNTASGDAVRVAERLRSQIERVAFPAGPDGSPRRVTVSVGEVCFPHDGHNEQGLLARARACLEEAARRGGNTVVHGGGL